MVWKTLISGLVLMAALVFIATQRLRTPAYEEALESAERVALQHFNRRCGPSEIESVNHTTNLRPSEHGTEMYDIRSTIRLASGAESTVGTFVYPQFDFWALKVPNVDIIGVDIRCGE